MTFHQLKLRAGYRRDEHLIALLLTLLLLVLATAFLATGHQLGPVPLLWPLAAMTTLRRPGFTAVSGIYRNPLWVSCVYFVGWPYVLWALSRDRWEGS